MYHIVINPASKSGRGLSIWKTIEPVLQKKSISYSVYYSEYPGHIMELMKELTSTDSPENNIIIVGGDGTMNEALQGVSDFSKCKIGYIPTGSSNDFARALHYPKTAEAQLDRILSCEKEMLLDIGKVTYLDTATDSTEQYRLFDVSCGIGFDAAVCEEALHGSSGFKLFLNKLGLGKLTYLSIALKHLLVNTGVSLSVTLDDNPPIYREQFLFVAAMQNKYEGGGFMFCPDASPTDGTLDICMVTVKNKGKIFMALPLAFFGKHTLFKNIDCYRAKKIHICTSGPLWVHTDGEVARKSSDFIIETLPDKMRFLM